MGLDHEYRRALTRRHLFRAGAAGLGAAALASLLPGRAGARPAPPHHAPRARRAIYLVMNGGPSQLDLFDHKPRLADLSGTDLPASVRGGQRLTTMTSGQRELPVAPSRFRFARHGRSGTWVSELLPWTARVADKLCVVTTVHTDAINHDPAVTLLCTGSQLPDRPSLGAWLSYGLGSAADGLPAFVVMTPTWTRGDDQALYQRLWGSGFLPGRHAGVALQARGDPVLFLDNPPGVDAAARRRMLDSLARLNGRQFDASGDPETRVRVEQYELAFRMQSSVPELVDLRREPVLVRDLYGPDAANPGTFAASCLLARRLVERGVRFVQIFHRGWDQHEKLPADLPTQCGDVDRACYGLVTDLDRRGLLDDTLVIWGGEFGRTVYGQGRLTRETYGRDHHPRCFTVWMAGGGVKAGTTYGETDDFGYNVARDPVHVHDLNATVLHLLGIDHARLTFRHQGLDARLTGVEGQGHGVVRGLLA